MITQLVVLKKVVKDDSNLRKQQVLDADPKAI